MHVVIIDYGMGNVASAKKAFEACGASVVISKRQVDIKKATHLVLPGVGAFGDGIKNLANAGLVPILADAVLKHKKPILGICLGMQLLAQKGHEFGTHKGLGWVKGEVIKLEFRKLRLPHIGWNNIAPKKNSVLFKDLPDLNFYFVHSFVLRPEQTSISAATCTYGQEFVASIQEDNIFATQFHPEKSQGAGLKVLENFLNFRS